MIPLKETTFDFQEINEQIIGAGILPISIDDNGAVRVLLGKERYINHWRGSLKWSGFEGGRKPGESVEYTAAREFIEESMGSVYLDNVVPTIHSVMNQVLTENYVARIVLCILHGEQSEKRYHVTYVMQVPYQCECTTLFNCRRRALIELQSKIYLLSKMSDQVLGTTALPHEDRGDNVSAIIRIEEDNKIIRVEYIDDNDETHIHEITGLSNETRELYNQWFQLRSTLTMECEEILTACEGVLSFKKNTNNLLISAKVNEDYIEKQTVQWWNLEDLKKVLENGGYSNTEFFRAYFLPVLQRAMTEVIEGCKSINVDDIQRATANMKLA